MTYRREVTGGWLVRPYAGREVRVPMLAEGTHIGVCGPTVNRLCFAADGRRAALFV